MKTKFKEVKNSYGHVHVFEYPDDKFFGTIIDKYNGWENRVSDFLVNIFAAQQRSNREEYIFLDIGAHVGYYSVLSCLINPDSIVYAFEPNEKLLPILKRNLNGFKFKIFDLAVSDNEEESILFYYEEETGGGSLFKENLDSNIGTIQEQKTRQASLRNLSIPFDKVKFVKIDIQGSEYSVLKDSWDLLQSGTIILCEVDEKSRKFILDKDVIILFDCDTNLIFIKR